MAFGVDYTGFLDSFDVNKVAGTDSRERAKLKSQAFMTDSKLGGAATGIIAQNKAESELEARTDLQKTKMRNDLEEKRMLQNKIIAEKKMQVDLEKSKSKN